MAVKRRLPPGTQSTAATSEVIPTNSALSTLEDITSKSDLWNSNNELKLFHALMAHTPIGIGKHFQMVLVLNKLSQEGLKSMTGPLIFEQLERFFNIPAIESLQNANLPLMLQTSSCGGAQSTTPFKVESTPVDNTYAEFQLPLKGFYRHFKEMTETSGVTVEDAEIYFPQETPKSTCNKRPKRSTPSSTNNAPPSKRRK